jgi:outer membrane protein OmpA-like peptidoglycan-associated protein
MKNICFLFLLAPALLGAQSARLKRANDAMADLDYMTAIVEYQQVLQKEDLPEAKINLAECYRKINDTENAEYWYEQVVKSPNPKPIHKLYYGMMLQANGKCDLAQVWLKQYQKEMPDDARGQFLAKACDMEEELRSKNKGIYTIRHLPFNSNLDDFGPVLIGQSLVFASDRDWGTAVKRTNMWTGNPFSELYAVALQATGAQPGDFDFGPAAKFSKAINTRYHEASVAVSPDSQFIYFTRNSFDDGKTGRSDAGLVKLKIYAARRTPNDGWGAVEALPFCSDEFNTAHPALSADGQRLYFSSNRPGGFGGMDLYYSERNGDTWGAPISLGPLVNTEGNEIFPFVDPNNRVYFASNGHIGLGGLDIFYTTEKDNGGWNLPANLGAPINSNRDDFGITFGGDLSWGFFTSDRDGGAGRDDIYGFQKNAAPVEIFVYDAQTRKALSGATVLNSATGVTLTTGSDGIIAFDMRFAECADFSAAKKGYEATLKTACADQSSGKITRIDIALSKQANFSVQGIVFDMTDGLPAQGARVVLLNDCGKNPSEPFVTDADGRFKFKLDKNCCYTIKATMEGFIAGVGEGICTKSQSQNPVFKINLNLEPYRDAEGFIVQSAEKNALRDEPRYNSASGLYEDADGQPASFDLGDGLLVRNGVLFDNGSPSKPEESEWERGLSGFLVHLYYNYDRAEVREESSPELKKLLKTLRENPDFQVEIASHTDARGSDDYNLQLSQRRADAVVEWLAQNGITRERLVPHGYGETKPVNDCANGAPCSEAEHQLNRRTEFRVIGTAGAASSKPQAKPKVSPCEGCPF